MTISQPFFLTLKRASQLMHSYLHLPKSDAEREGEERVWIRGSRRETQAVGQMEGRN